MQAGQPVCIAEATLAEVREHGAPLFREHYDEIARNKEVMVLDPDWERYEAMAARGELFTLALWAGTPMRMVGYSVNRIGTHLHYQGLTCVENDVLFVTKEFRGHGRQLINETERAAARRGARLMLWHAKEGSKLDTLLPALGYAVQDVIYSRQLPVGGF